MGSPKKFTDEFKCNAVAYCLEHKGEITHYRAAQNLGVSLSALNRWIVDPRYGGGDSSKILSTGEGDLAAQNKCLRKENARLKEEREILKAAAAFFAAEESRKNR